MSRLSAVGISALPAQAVAEGQGRGGCQCDQVMEVCESDPYAATRRAIVRAAAEIGRARG